MDIREQITNAIIARLEQGAGRWRKPWSTPQPLGLPRNYKTRQAYSGVNILLLWLAAEERGYEQNTWLTFNQALAIGAKVRRAAKGVLCIFYKLAELKNREPDSDEQTRCVPLMKPFWLFNTEDIEGLPATAAAAAAPFAPIEAAEQLLQACGARIEHVGGRALYDRAADAIRLPVRERFARPVDYYATALHELTHWTGHAERLNRDFGQRFGDEAYAFEELVAELGSSFLLADLGLTEYTLADHASYLDGWLRTLKRDKTAIFTAAKHASAAHEFIQARLPAPAGGVE